MPDPAPLLEWQNPLLLEDPLRVRAITSSMVWKRTVLSMEAMQFLTLRLQHWALTHMIGSSATEPQTKRLSCVYEGKEGHVESSGFAETERNEQTGWV